MLETTLKSQFIPGTNLRGELGCVDWRFLLSSLDLDNILCVGVPSAVSLAALSEVVPVLIVVSDDLQQLQNANRQCKILKISNIHFIRIGKFASFPFSNKSVNLVLLTWSKKCTKIFRKQTRISEYRRILRESGAILFEIQCLSAPLIQRSISKKFLKLGFDSLKSFWLTPLKGVFRTALPIHDGKIASYFFTNVLFGQSFKKRLLSRIGKVCSKVDLISYISPHRAILAKRSSASSDISQVPDYILDIAQNAGIDISGCRFGLSARGKYNANKVIFYLFSKEAHRLVAVVKMTRSEEFNQRLENEYRVLQRLSNKNYIDKDTFPEPLFFGYHKNLGLIGLKGVKGHPFRTQTEGTINCPVARNAADWILKLGSASATKNVGSPQEVSNALYELFGRFNAIYGLPKNEKHFLIEQINSIRQSGMKFPLVFQHGDPGTWNIMVSKDGSVKFIDWEAGDPQGIPLWDLFYFLKTYSSWVSRMKGSRDGIGTFLEHFFSPSEMSSTLVKLIDDYCKLVELDKDLIEPLFHTCWMHRALKEATRLTKISLQKGLYVNLLRLGIQSKNRAFLLSTYCSNNHS
jgi:hypothetical protein